MVIVWQFAEIFFLHPDDELVVKQLVQWQSNWQIEVHKKVQTISQQAEANGAPAEKNPEFWSLVIS